MKNWIKSMFIVLCGMMIATTFLACGSDDDDNNNEKNGTEEIVGINLAGKWNITHWQRLRNGEWVDEIQTPPYDMIVFFADGKVEYWEYDGQESENRSDDRERVFGSNYYHEDGTGTWQKNGNSYTFSPGIELVSYDGNNKAELIVNWGKKSYHYYLERAE